MKQVSSATVVFSCLGHLYNHVFTAFFFVIVLALETEWMRPYHELIDLWTVPALLFGAVALPAGMLADRVGATRMMVLYFIGMGGFSIAAGFTSSASAMVAALCGLAVFGAIYHPVGVPWLVRNAGENQGKALGVHGVFGSMGTASAALLTGFLVDYVGWRAAFWVPGAIALITGLALWRAYLTGAVTDGVGTAAAGPNSHSRGEVRRVFLILLVTMFLASLIYHSMQAGLPKLVEQRNGGLVSSVAGVGLVVAGMYLVAGLMQIAGGYLADRFPLKPIYFLGFALQVPLLAVASSALGVSFIGSVVLALMVNLSALPAENMLLARYLPAHRHGFAFGVKFVLSFAAGPVAVQLIARITGVSGDFYWVLMTLGALAALAAVVVMLLPAGRRPATPPRVAMAGVES